LARCGEDASASAPSSPMSLFFRTREVRLAKRAHAPSAWAPAAAMPFPPSSREVRRPGARKDRPALDGVNHLLH
jgi:hypothetical protein